jgi:HSP20 family protein
VNSLRKRTPNWLPECSGPDDWPSIADTPKVDVYTTKEHLVIKVELPGLAKENLSVSVRDSMLIVAGEKKRESEVNEQQYQQIECSYGRFERTFTLPQGTDPQKIKSTFRDGLLQITVPNAAPPGKTPCVSVPID